MITAKWRGHSIYYDDPAWRFIDDDSPVADTWQQRPCGFCGEYPTSGGHDYCIANLPLVMNACCGHGDVVGAYVQFMDGRILRGPAAIEFQIKND